MGRKLIVVFCLVLLWSGVAQGVTGDITLTDKELLERLTRLEEGQRALSQRFDDLRESTNQRFTDLKQSIDKRFDDMNRRFDQVLFWLELLFGTMIVMLAGIFTHGVLLWRRQTRTETLIENHLRETEKDRLLSMQSEEIKQLKERLAKVEEKVA
jgi:tetrahydromethanopterin S-methyltransferase subunit G